MSKLCPYCGEQLLGNIICPQCGSHTDPNLQYFDPLEQAWQQGRFLRNFKYGKVILAIILIAHFPHPIIWIYAFIVNFFVL